MEECRKRGYNNNTSIDKMKFDKYDYCRYIAIIVDNQIHAISGVHNMDIDSRTYFRCGFRGVSLATYPSLSRNYRKTSYNVGINWFLLMRLVMKEVDSNAQFVVTTNDYSESIETAGDSHHADKFYKTVKPEGYSLLYEKITYMYTVQNVWKLDYNIWERDFYKYHVDRITLDYALSKLV